MLRKALDKQLKTFNNKFKDVYRVHKGSNQAG
jgi:hypothetical protein